jgi:hypothetical protein
MTTLKNLVDGNLGVVCHDAGAANLIIHWLKDYQGEFFVCMEGPAKVIWENKFPSKKNYKLEVVLSNSNILLSGTGSGDFEYQARLLASSMNHFNIAVIDNWTKYQERFQKSGVISLPDLILVSDNYALDMAKSFFPNVKIIQLENLYLKHHTNLSFISRKREPQIPARNILMVMGPSKEEIEFISIDYFFSNLDKCGLSANSIKIRLRTHPSESFEKYNDVMKKYSDVECTISKNNNLSDDIAWADMVVGMQNFPMVIAVNSNIPTISIIPPRFSRCALPYSEIIHLRDL